MIRWLLDAIDTEIAKPDGEADMVVVEECTVLLGELTGGVRTLSKRELEKRCNAIIRGDTYAGGKSKKKCVRLVAAIAACLAVFVVISGCGYLPSITTVLSTLFASGVGKDVEIHEVTYTNVGEVKLYDSVDHLISTEELNILLPTLLPENTYITKVLNNPESDSIYILFNNSEISFQIFTNITLEEYIVPSAYEKHESNSLTIYTKQLTASSYLAYCEINNNVYSMQYSDINTIIEVFNSLR